jgi:hypothetical protein
MCKRGGSCQDDGRRRRDERPETGNWICATSPLAGLGWRRWPSGAPTTPDADEASAAPNHSALAARRAENRPRSRAQRNLEPLPRTLLTEAME